MAGTVDVGTLLVKYQADITQLIAKNEAAAASLEETGAAATGAGGMVAMGAAVAGAAIIGMGVKSVSMAANFQSSMAQLVTGAGESASNLKMVSDGILAMATDTGASTQQLSDGMYMIESAGYHGAAGLAVLQAAAEGAKVGNASLADVANGVTTAMTDYAKSGLTAAQATNDLIATVAAGKTHMGDLAHAMSTILPTSAAVGVSFTDVSGAMATMTGEGTDAASAATYLRQLLMALESPAKAGAKALASVGLTTQQVSDDMKVSLPSTLAIITEAIGKKFPVGSSAYISAIKAISGGSKQMQGMLELTGDHLRTFATNTEGIAGAVKKGGSSIAGWSTIQGTFNFKMDKAREVVETLGIKIGMALLPVVGSLLDKATPLVTAFGNWATSSQGLGQVLANIGNVIGPVATGIGSFVVWMQQGSAPAQAVGIALLMIAGGFAAIQIGAFVAAVPALVAGFIAWGVAAWTAAAGTIAATWPLFAIGAAVVAVVAIIILAVQHWGAISAWLQGAWSGVVGFFGAIWHGIQGFFGGVGNWFHDRFTDAQNGVKTGFGNTGNWFQQQGQIIQQNAQTIGQGVVNAFNWMYQHNTYFKDMVDGIKTLVHDWQIFLTMVWSAISADATKAWSAITSWISAQWNKLSTLASAVFTVISGFITSKIQYAVTYITAAWAVVQGWLAGEWAQLQGLAQTAWNGVVSVFTGLWGQISSPLNTLWANISGWFSNLASAAFSWGANIIQGIINGIGSMFSALGSAASGAAGTVAQYLGFHSPAKQGPGKELDIWGPNLVKGFAQGIDRTAPLLQATMQHLMTVGTYPIRPSAIGVAASSAQVASSGSTSDHTTIVEIDGYQLATVVQKSTDRLVRLKLGAKGRSI